MGHMPKQKFNAAHGALFLRPRRPWLGAQQLLRVVGSCGYVPISEVAEGTASHTSRALRTFQQISKIPPLPSAFAWIRVAYSKRSHVASSLSPRSALRNSAPPRSSHGGRGRRETEARALAHSADAARRAAFGDPPEVAHPLRHTMHGGLQAGAQIVPHAYMTRHQSAHLRNLSES